MHLAGTAIAPTFRLGYSQRNRPKWPCKAATKAVMKTVTKPSPATANDVAKLAGVSQPSVSRAFTPGASQSAQMRQKILAAAQTLGYRPNFLARSLKAKKSNMIALAISHLENPFYAQVVKELSEQLRASNRQVLLFTASDRNVPDPALANVLNFQVDALIMAATRASPELMAQCLAVGVPIVQINRETKHSEVSTVRGKNKWAGKTAAQHFFDAGHTRFAYVGGTKSSSTTRIRYNGFKQYLAEKGIHSVPVAYGNNSFEGATTAARELLSAPERPDAIFCASDYMAFAIIDIAKNEFNLNVPKDLSVIGFDDVPEAGKDFYDLTTFYQPASLLVEAAIKAADEMIAHPENGGQRYHVSGELIIRGSTRNPAQN